MERIEKVADYFVGKWNEETHEVEEFEQLFGKINETPFVYIENDRRIDLGALLPYTKVQPAVPTLKGISKLDLKLLYNSRNSILDEYMIKCVVNGSGRFEGRDGSYSSEVRYVDSTRSHRYILCQEKPKGVQLDYIKEVIGQCWFVFFMGKRTLRQYSYLLKLGKYPKSEWRQVIKEYLSIQDKVVARFKKLENIKPTEEWLKIRKEARAKGVKTYVDKEEINPKYASRSQRSGNYATFTSNVPIKLIDARRAKYLHVYGKLEDKDMLDAIYGSQRAGRVRVAMVAERDYQRLEKANLHNWIKIEKYMEGDNKPFRIYVTAFLLDKLKDANGSIWNHHGIKYISYLNKEFAEKMVTLENYVQKNCYSTTEKVKEAMLKVALDYNLWDQDILSIYHEVEDKISNFNFMSGLKDISYPKPDSQAVKIGAEILKYRKFKLDNHHYTPPVKEEVEVVDEKVEVPDEDYVETDELEEEVA